MASQRARLRVLNVHHSPIHPRKQHGQLAV
jgi:hypothetical protein